jgi:ABC-type multidrug transport system fused ATPase/permease subunit
MIAKFLIPAWTLNYNKFVRLERRHFLLGATFTVLSAVAEAIGLSLLGYAASRPDSAMHVALILSAAIAASLALSACVRAGGDRQMAHAQVTLERRLRDSMSSAIMDSDWQDFVDQPGHELQSAVLAEAPQVANSTAVYVRGVASLWAALVVFLAAFVVSVPAAAVCAFFAGFIGWAYNHASRGLGEAQRRLADGNAVITRHTSILVSGLRTLRLAPIQGAWRTDLSRAFDAQAAARTSDILIPVRSRLIVDMMGAAMILSVLVTQTVLTGEILPGLIVMALILRVLPRLQAAQQALALARHATVWIERWNTRMATISAAPPLAIKVRQPADSDLSPLLELDGVSFSYRTHSSSVINELTYTLRVGDWLSLIGSSGGGKSTLIDLLGGILKPSSGEIRLAGRDIAGLDPDSLHGEIAIVPQDIHLIGASLEEILTWGGRLPKPDNYDKICSDLGIAEMFLYSTAQMSEKVDELSRDISGGMRTRLAIARALMSKPRLLVLDETTSRLNPSAEAEIFAAIRRSMPSLAVLVVTHRHETAKTVGEVLRLVDGQLVRSSVGMSE